VANRSADPDPADALRNPRDAVAVEGIDRCRIDDAVFTESIVGDGPRADKR
jgi:hypothetical protein